jgi:hypothetical protein
MRHLLRVIRRRVGPVGSMTIGVGANVVGWWLSLPAGTWAGTYTSTVTLKVISAP